VNKKIPTEHFFWMSRALNLARKGLGWTSPNPMVGAVVVKDGEAIAEGYHERVGEAHAERIALDLAGEEARGATLYVTLEPCAHQGRTPPCVERVIASGVERVVMAMIDPYPLVAGRSVEAMTEAGIEVVVGVCEREARLLNLPFLSGILRARPWVTLKYAMTLDGRIALRSGKSQWITNHASRLKVQELRASNRAILVGYRTAVLDDPTLDARIETDPPPRQPLRIVLGGDKPLSESGKLAQTLDRAETLHVTAFAMEEPEGIENVVLPASDPDSIELGALLEFLHAREVDSLLVEGGAWVLSQFLAKGLADEVHAFIAPRILNDREGVPPFLSDAPKESLDQTHNLMSATVTPLEGDVLVHGFLTDPHTLGL
jgi:diaminohydroxyphosphoribosylaminopyrimidine deaminase/5-amino-6-(5-phosphoribosylamino)uracil reductase